MPPEWLGSARRDLARIFAFNAERSEDYARRVDALLVEKANIIARAPATVRPVGRGGLRAVSVVEIQYVITYAVIDDHVAIFRIRHTRENREQP